MKFKNKFVKTLSLIFIFLFFILILSYLNKCDTSSSQCAIVHFIDVDQGDAILIQVNNKNLLIDSGPSSAKNKLFNYLKKLKITTFDYVIATHPHEDHIGNMSILIRKYNIKMFLSPKITSTSETFEDMVTSLNDKKLKINVLKENSNLIDLGENTSIDIHTLQNINDTDNLNLYSPIIKFTFKNTSFIFTGDAETDNELDLIKRNINIKSDVLKVGHHGSNSSSSENFIKTIYPKVAIISVGENNSYGHPSVETLNTLEKFNIKILRTDLNGPIILKSNGSSISYYSIK